MSRYLRACWEAAPGWCLLLVVVLAFGLGILVGGLHLPGGSSVQFEGCSRVVVRGDTTTCYPDSAPTPSTTTAPRLPAVS